MQGLTNEGCPKHQQRLLYICTREECFVKNQMLVCKDCVAQHSHSHSFVDFQLFVDEIKGLMGKRITLEKNFENACDKLLVELRKFKVFKKELLESINNHERSLNELCRRIMRNLSARKDSHIFKRNFSCLYLSMREINPNFESYHQFCKIVHLAISDVKRTLHRYQSNWEEIPLLRRKEFHVYSVLRKISDSSDEPQAKEGPHNKIKSVVLRPTFPTNCEERLLRINDTELVSFSKGLPFLRIFHTDNFANPRVIAFPAGVEQAVSLDRYLITSCKGNRLIMGDMLAEEVVREYASTNHRNAAISQLAHLDGENSILGFLENPNQVFNIKFQEAEASLKIMKGADLTARVMSSVGLESQFACGMDDSTLRIYEQTFELSKTMQTDSVVFSIARGQTGILVAGGATDGLRVFDCRQMRLVQRIPVGLSPRGQVKRVSEFVFTSWYENCLRGVDIRSLKVVSQISFEDSIQDFVVMNSNTFVTAGRSIELKRCLGQIRQP